MRIGVVRGLEAERPGVAVHLLQEVLHGLVRLHSPLVFGISAGSLAQARTTCSGSLRGTGIGVGAVEG